MLRDFGCTYDAVDDDGVKAIRLGVAQKILEGADDVAGW